MRQKPLHVLKLLAVSGSITASAALSYNKQFTHCRNSNSVTSKTPNTSTPRRLFATSVTVDGASPSPLRTYKTHLDEYYQQHQSLPLPKIVHAELLPSTETESNNGKCKNILVIGDVHGCYQELLLLHKKAKQEYNQNHDFQYVILVGDLVNKGPHSIQVLRAVRTQANWLAVRGNHDNAALQAALGDPQRANKPKYQWVQELSDEDLLYLSELPYTLKIPSQLLNHNTTSTTTDTLIVHAGLIPHIPLEQQTVETMITLRDIQQQQPWASVWKGPYHVVFGHDARRELQQYPWATGLDTGACYGKKLTGIILPANTLVQVDALQVYCPIKHETKE